MKELPEELAAQFRSAPTSAIVVRDAVPDYGDVSAWVFSAAVSVPARCLLARLYVYARGGVQAFPSQATLAAEFGVNERSVRRWLKELEEAAYLQRYKRTDVDPAFRGNPNAVLYVLVSPAAVPLGQICPIRPDKFVLSDRTPVSAEYKQGIQARNKVVVRSEAELKQQFGDVAYNRAERYCRERNYPANQIERALVEGWDCRLPEEKRRKPKEHKGEDYIGGQFGDAIDH